MLDLRDFLQQLEEPVHLRTVEKTVDRQFEIARVVQALENKKEFPALLFQHVKGSEFRHLINTFADFKRLAIALDTTRRDLPFEFRRRSNQPFAPVLVERNEAPVKERVYTGDDVNLDMFPIILHHQLDAGPYISGGVTTVRDPETGRHNLGIYRLKQQDSRTTGIHVAPTAHGYQIMMKYWERGQAMPVAIAIGHHPAYYLAGAGVNESDRDEYELVGGIMNEPLALVRAETSDLLVPAAAEIIIEGEVPPYERMSEAPFGEFTGVYGPEGARPIVRVKAVTCRHDAIYQSIMVGHPDNILVGIVGRLASFYDEARKVSAGVRNVHVPISGRGRYACYVAIDPLAAGEAKEVLMRVLTADSYLKFAVAVDGDVDIYDEAAINHEIFTKVRPREDTFVVPGVKACSIDPVTTHTQGRAATDGVFDKVGIDATTPHDYPEQIYVPDVESVRLERYWNDEG